MHVCWGVLGAARESPHPPIHPPTTHAYKKREREREKDRVPSTHPLTLSTIYLPFPPQRRYDRHSHNSPIQIPPPTHPPHHTTPKPKQSTQSQSAFPSPPYTPNPSYPTHPPTHPHQTHTVYSVPERLSLASLHPTSLLSTTKTTLQKPRRKVILQGVSGLCRAGELTAILGPTGGG